MFNVIRNKHLFQLYIRESNLNAACKLKFTEAYHTEIILKKSEKMFLISSTTAQMCGPYNKFLLFQKHICSTSIVAFDLNLLQMKELVTGGLFTCFKL
jgi:hypothetical protein